jgi:hypothetical protein
MIGLHFQAARGRQRDNIVRVGLNYHSTDRGYSGGSCPLLAQSGISRLTSNVRYYCDRGRHVTTSLFLLDYPVARVGNAGSG